MYTHCEIDLFNFGLRLATPVEELLICDGSWLYCLSTRECLVDDGSSTISISIPPGSISIASIKKQQRTKVGPNNHDQINNLKIV